MAMDIHVYDTYVKAKDGHTMHFDVITNVQDHDKAIEFAEQAYSNSSHVPQVIETYGNALLLAGQADKSIEVLSEGLKKRPTDAFIALRLAEAKIKVGKIQEAKMFCGFAGNFFKKADLPRILGRGVK